MQHNLALAYTLMTSGRGASFNGHGYDVVRRIWDLAGSHIISVKCLIKEGREGCFQFYVRPITSFV